MIAGCGKIDLKEKVHEDVSTYLKNKYGNEFEFEFTKIDMIYHSLYGYYSYKAYVYPKDHPEWEFKAWGYFYRDGNGGTEGDNYLSIKWSFQGKLDFKKTLNELYENNIYIKSYNFDYNNYKFKTLNFREVITECNGAAKIWIEYFAFIDGKVNKKDEAGYIYKLINKYMTSNRIRRFRIAVYYLPINCQKNSSFCIGKEDKNTLNKSNIDKLYKENKIINYALVWQIKSEDEMIEKIEIDDIVSAFKY
jgi:hypothetical protein